MNKLDYSLLTDLPPFRGLTRPQIPEILDVAQTARFDAGTTVFDQGTAVDRFVLLLDGHVRVQRTSAEDDPIILLHIAPGQLFGIGAALCCKTYAAIADAADEFVVLAWPNRL
jgi:CRP/FNR family transcriptional regulator, nitrogen oxide reductase regulator